jgi:hypothetical protein
MEPSKSGYTPKFRKREEDCRPITLVMRKYYTAERVQAATERRRANKDAINAKLRERYQNDPVYRERILQRTRENYRRKAAQAAALTADGACNKVS